MLPFHCCLASAQAPTPSVCHAPLLCCWLGRTAVAVLYSKFPKELNSTCDLCRIANDSQKMSVFF